MTFVEIKNLASAIQSISIATAVIIGGIWALYRFYSLKSIETAKLELEKSKKELSSQGVLDIQLDALVVPSLSGAAVINVTIKNIGSKDEIIDSVNSSISLGVIDENSTDDSSIDEYCEAKHLLIESLNYFVIVSPGEVKTMSYLATGLQDKVYLIMANLVGSKELNDHHENVASNSGLSAEYISFGGELYFDFHANKNLKRDC